MTRLPAACILAVVIASLAGCSSSREQRRWGDPAGTPVAFEVAYDSAFIASMSEPAPWDGFRGFHGGFGYSDFGPYGPWHHHHHHHHGHWHHGYHPWGFGGGFWAAPPPPTRIEIWGGDGPGQAQLFRKRLGDSPARFTVPIRPGRTVTLTVQVAGGRTGWETIGAFIPTAQVGQQVRIDLTRTGPALTHLVPAAPAGEPPPAAAARPADPAPSAEPLPATAPRP